MKITKDFAIARVTMGNLVCLTIYSKDENYTTGWYETLSDLKGDIQSGVAQRAKCHMIETANYEVIQEVNTQEEALSILLVGGQFKDMLKGDIKI